MLEPTLPQTWRLYGADVPALAPVRSRAHVVVVDDVETLCASIVVDVSRSGAPYAASELCDLYEAVGFLLGRVIEVLPRYDPTRGRQVHDPWTNGFKAWLHSELVRDLHDQWRSWYGRHGHKRMVQFDFGSDTGGISVDGDERTIWSRGERRSLRAASADQGDRGDDRGDVLRGLLEGGDREVLREVEALGLRPHPRAGGGAPQPDRRVREAA